MTTGTRFEPPDWNGWTGPSGDPNDRQFGDAIEPVTLEDPPNVALVGEPYDGAVIGRRGAREGAAAIREALASVKTAHLGGGDPLGDHESPTVGDLGDVPIPEGGVAAVQEGVREVAAEIHDAGALPVFLGGDNSLTYANVAPLLDERVGVINFDAHLDCREPLDGPTSGTPYRQLLEDGLAAYVAVGARHFETSETYVEYVRERGGTVVPSDAFEEGGVDGVVERVREAVAGVETLYVSVDCDVLDATAAPGVSAPTPGGLSTRELFSAVGSLAGDDRLAGCEVVECSPPLDRGGLTVDAAARTVAHGITGYLEGHL